MGHGTCDRVRRKYQGLSSRAREGSGGGGRSLRWVRRQPAPQSRARAPARPRADLLTLSLAPPAAPRRLRAPDAEPRESYRSTSLSAMFRLAAGSRAAASAPAPPYPGVRPDRSHRSRAMRSLCGARCRPLVGVRRREHQATPAGVGEEAGHARGRFAPGRARPGPAAGRPHAAPHTFDALPPPPSSSPLRRAVCLRRLLLQLAGCVIRRGWRGEPLPWRLRPV